MRRVSSPVRARAVHILHKSNDSNLMKHESASVNLTRRSWKSKQNAKSTPFEYSVNLHAMRLINSISQKTFAHNCSSIHRTVENQFVVHIKVFWISNSCLEGLIQTHVEHEDAKIRKNRLKYYLPGKIRKILWKVQFPVHPA